jgi:cytochrome c-type biogenesis protein
VIWAAVSAGVLSALNPCAYVLLPAILGRFLLKVSAPSRLLAGLKLGLGLSAGVLSVFVIVGFIVMFLGYTTGRVFPYVAIALAVLFLIVGVWIIAGRTVHLSVPLPDSGNYLLFGLCYGLASLGCTLPIFIAFTGMALHQEGVVGALMLMSYGLGIAGVLLALSIATALGKRLVSRLLRRLQSHLEPLGGILLIAAAVYLLYYNLGFLLFDYSLGLRLAAGSGVLALMSAILWRHLGMRAAKTPVR